MTYARHAGREDRASTARTCWLVNTGWTGGPYGVGKRMSIALHPRHGQRRARRRARQGGDAPDPIFGLEVPVTCPGVPDEVLWPRNTWADKAAYDEAARNLAKRFQDNFAKFEDQVTAEVRHAGPKAG